MLSGAEVKSAWRLVASVGVVGLAVSAALPAAAFATASSCALQGDTAAIFIAVTTIWSVARAAMHFAAGVARTSAIAG